MNKKEEEDEKGKNFRSSFSISLLLKSSVVVV